MRDRCIDHWRRWTAAAAQAHLPGPRALPTQAWWRGRGLFIAGNMLVGPEVTQAALGGYSAAAAMPFPERRVGALRVAAGDAPGLLSVARLVLGRDMAPLTLRTNHAVNPLAAMADLYLVSQSDPCRSRTRVVQGLDDSHRAPASEAVPEVP